MNGMTLITVLTLLLPPQAAQETRDAGLTVAPGLILAQAGQQKPQPPPPPPPPPPESVKRRGSFVGYIDDAVVASKLRLRFEAGFENQVPDRVEFFYAKCGCYRDLPEGEALRDPDSPGPGPGAANDLNFQQVYIQGEVAVGRRMSLFGEFPLRWIQPQAFFEPSLGGTEGFSDQSGLSDIRVGVKAEVLSTPAQVVTVQLRGYLPTGDSEKGLGTDHATLEPALLMYHRIGDRASIESQVGLWYPLGGADGLPITADDKFSAPVFFYGIGPSVDVYRTSRMRFGPVVELVGWHLTGGFQSFPPDDDEVDASGVNIVNIKFGARLTWNDTDTIYGGWGRGLTDRKWYRDLIRVEYRRTF
jgi:hypothetical protein